MALSQSALRAPSFSRSIAERATPEPEGLVGIGLTIQATPRQTIVLEGDPCSHCFRMLTGTVCLYKGTIDGRRQLIDFLVAGDYFGSSVPATPTASKRSRGLRWSGRRAPPWQRRCASSPGWPSG